MGIADKILDFLEQAQIHCCKSFPNGKMPLLEEPAVMVHSKEMKISPCVISNHFGNRGDDVCRAAMCEEEVQLQIYSPYLWGGRFCDRTTDSILQIVLGAITGNTFRSIRRGQSYYDPETDCFRNDITIASLAWVRLLEE